MRWPLPWQEPEDVAFDRKAFWITGIALSWLLVRMLANMSW